MAIDEIRVDGDESVVWLLLVDEFPACLVAEDFGCVVELERRLRVIFTGKTGVLVDHETGIVGVFTKLVFELVPYGEKGV